MGRSTFLVTGSAGFIGSHLAERLLERGDRVIGLDNFDDFYDRSIKERNLAASAEHEGSRFVEGDIRDRDLLTSLFASEPIDAVVHLAAKAGVRPSVERPDLYADVNVRGTALLLEHVQKAGIKRVIYASSSSVYGGNEKVPFSEADPVDRPVSPYAATKKATELIAETFHHLYGIDTIGLRFFTVYGPRQRPEMAIHRFVRLIEAGQPVPMFGDGSSRRDYTYIDDIVSGVLAAIDRGKGSRIYNLGESETTRLDELIRMIGQALGRSPEIRRLAAQPGDVPQTYADISRARAELGYAPGTKVQEGVSKFVEWFRAEQPVEH